MNSANFNLFFSAAMFLCAVMAILVLFRIRSRGSAALLMSAAFIVMGGLLFEMKAGASQATIGALSVVLAALLISDFAVRSVKQRDKEPRP